MQRRPPNPPDVPPWCRHPFRKREYRCEGCGDPIVWPERPEDAPPVCEPPPQSDADS